MNSYMRQSPQDQEFRRVAIKSAIAPKKFEQFTSDNQMIQYEDEVILEIKRQDGSCVLVYEGTTKTLYYTCKEKVISFFPEAPIERLWCRERNGNGIMYKVPANLPIRDDGKCYFAVSDKASDVELCGDSYLNMVFDFQKQ